MLYVGHCGWRTWRQASLPSDIYGLYRNEMWAERIVFGSVFNATTTSGVGRSLTGSPQLKG